MLFRTIRYFVNKSQGLSKHLPYPELTINQRKFIDLNNYQKKITHSINKYCIKSKNKLQIIKFHL